MTTVKKHHKHIIHHNIIQNDTMRLNKANKIHKVADMFDHCDNYMFNRFARLKEKYHSVTNNESHYFNTYYFTSNHYIAINRFDNFTTPKQVKTYQQTPSVTNQEIHFCYINT